jgi:hypothetical protein
MNQEVILKLLFLPALGGIFAWYLSELWDERKLK